MLEYINYSALILLIIILIGVMLLNKFDKKRDKFLYILIIISIVLLFLDANNEYKNAKENIRAYNIDIPLKCSSGGGLFSSSDKYRVLKEDGWSLQRDYFIKETLMIRTNKCEK